jgi:hypothetical protein
MDIRHVREIGRLSLSPQGPATKLITLRVTESQRKALYERAKKLGYRRLSDFARDRLEIDLDAD